MSTCLYSVMYWKTSVRRDIGQLLLPHIHALQNIGFNELSFSLSLVLSVTQTHTQNHPPPVRSCVLNFVMRVVSCRYYLERKTQFCEVIIWRSESDRVSAHTEPSLSGTRPDSFPWVIMCTSVFICNCGWIFFKRCTSVTQGGQRRRGVIWGEM